ncbi:MAG: PKD domain-containing protein, partial [Firmicutes bacterium]|nr:PKD domain-containing protein [Bacillota bacterium]
MRLLAIPCLLVVSAQFPRTPLPVASSLAVLTPRPRVDTPTSFKLASAPAGNVIWDFGDGTPPQSAPSSVSHTYRSPGNFTVKATAGRSVTQQSLTVIEPRKVVVSLGAGKSATLKLEEAIGSTLLWNFGDGGRPVEGSASLTHTFAREGDFTVKGQDTPPGLPPREFTAKVSIGKGSAVTFGVSRLTLRWEDGSVERNVPLGEAGLVAYADLGFEGSGTFQAEWLVDGKSQHSLSTTLGAPQPSNLRPLSAPAVSLGATTTAGNRQTLSTAANGQTPVPLPTNLPGEHRVTLKVIQPKLDFPVPVLRYTVQATSETSGLTIQSIMPSHGKPGEEVELTLTGTGFSADMALNLGKDVAVLGKPVLISPDKAVVRVFVAPTAQAGPRSFQIRRGGRSFGATASFEVVTAGQVPSGKEPGKLQTPSLGSVGKLPTTGTSVSPVQTSKEAGKGQVLPLGPAAKLTATSASANPALRQPPIDLARVGRSSAGASRMVPLQGAKGAIAILDVNAGSRFEKFLQCNQGQRLDLTKITLSSPSFSMIGYNSGGEFPRDIIPVLRDDTRFSWQEQKPGTSEYFELQFFAAKDGTLLKTQRVPGNRSTFDVTPAFVQELTRLIGQHIPKTMIATPSNASRPGLVTGSSPSSKERITTPHTPQRPLAMGQGKPVVSSTPAPAAVQSSQTSTGMSKAVIQAITPKPDLEIPAVMQQKASVVWRVIGYRSYPCLSTPAIPEGIAKPATPTVALPPPRPIRGKTPSLPAPAVMTAGGKQTSPVITRTAGATPPAHGPSAASGPERSTPPVFQNVIAEVSRSGVWPFRVPAQPQGVNRNGCIVAQADPKIVLEANKKGNSGGSGHFQMVSTSHPKGSSSSGNPPKNSLDESIYTFDEIWLHGEFDLSAARVPYRLIPASVLPKSGSGGGGQGGFPISTVGQVVFKNVFVDWGDGTLEAFRGQPVDQLFASSNGNYSGTDFYSRYKVDAGAMKHVYARAAIAPPYRVKVFVLSEEDMGRSNIVGEVSQALTPVQTNKGLFSGLSRLSAVTKTLPMTASPGAKTSSTVNPILSQTASKTQPSALSAAVLLDAPSSASQALGRAYEVFCRELPIVEREDPCANGPLNLVAVDLEFPANDKAPVPVAATSRTKASSPAANPPPLHTPKVQVPGSANRTSQTQLNASSMTAGAALSNTSGGEVNHGPTTTPCNLFYSVQTRVKYYGVGTLRVVWKVGGKQVGSREQPVKSPKRTGLKADECLSCKNPLYGELTLNSPALPVNVLGRQIVTAEVDVLPDKSGDVDLRPAMMGILSGAKASLAPRVAHTLTATLSTGKTAKLPLRLGILNPSPAPGQPAFVSLNKVAVAEGVQAALSAMTQPPFHVETSGVYEVKASDPAKLCNIFFPSKGGLFPITNLQGMKLTPEGSLSKATGKGLLVLGVKAGTAPDAIAPCPLPISFGDWSLDGVTVVQGKFDLKPDGQTGEYNGPGVKGAVKEVLGAIADKNAPQDMRLRMELSPIDTSMVTGDGTEAPKWLAEAPVTIQGDWYATKDLGGNPLKLGRTKLGPTPWF